MKANLTAVAAALIVAGFSMNASAANIITFTGTVTEESCSISGGTGAGSGAGASSFTVPLSEVSTDDLGSAGATTGDKTFSINVGGAPGGPGDCGALNGRTAKMSWSTSQAGIDLAHNALKNTGTAGTDVGIQLADGYTGATIDLGNPAGTTNGGDQVAGGTAELKYTARYVAINPVVDGGSVSAQLEYVVVYN